MSFLGVIHSAFELNQVRRVRSQQQMPRTSQKQEVFAAQASQFADGLSSKIQTDVAEEIFGYFF